ncbi:MAG: hypothetical protein IIU01_05365, partial [Oscillospiraceae bacterium]|nr:hypothetical protein [Oscillospiraceae bacterium]
FRALPTKRQGNVLEGKKTQKTIELLRGISYNMGQRTKALKRPDETGPFRLLRGKCFGNGRRG